MSTVWGTRKYGAGLGSTSVDAAALGPGRWHTRAPGVKFLPLASGEKCNMRGGARRCTTIPIIAEHLFAPSFLLLAPLRRRRAAAPAGLRAARACFYLRCRGASPIGR